MPTGAVITKMTTRLDEIIEAEAKTNDLMVNQDLVGEFVGAGQIQVAKMVIDGLGDYNRATGFPAGSLDITWETLTLSHDRGREFEIDRMDDEERAMVLSANAMAEFERTKVIPEVDAIRFATMADKAGTKKTGVAIADANFVDEFLVAEEAIAENSDLERVIIYLTQAVKNALRKKFEYRFGQGENPNGKFETFDDMKLVTVPQSRFYSAIDLMDGTSVGETGGGYKKASTGQDINFLMVDPQAVAAIQKHQTLRYFAPEVNQDKDAHKWQYRLFHDLLAFEKKAERIYVCTK